MQNSLFSIEFQNALKTNNKSSWHRVSKASLNLFAASSSEPSWCKAKAMRLEKLMRAKVLRRLRPSRSERFGIVKPPSAKMDRTPRVSPHISIFSAFSWQKCEISANNSPRDMARKMVRCFLSSFATFSVCSRWQYVQASPFPQSPHGSKQAEEEEEEGKKKEYRIRIQTKKEDKEEKKEEQGEEEEESKTLHL